MKTTSLQQVVYSQDDLRCVEGLDEKVLRSRRERPSPGLGRYVGGEHNYGEVDLIRGHGLQSLEYLEAVHHRHVKVQQDEIGLVGPVDIGNLGGFRGREYLRVSVRLQD